MMRRKTSAAGERDLTVGHELSDPLRSTSRSSIPHVCVHDAFLMVRCDIFRERRLTRPRPPPERARVGVWQALWLLIRTELFTR